uniref:Uncharacterized protein n=1 Tax=Rhizophora mucronata TaxID=61149 RepID=A0A2P2NUS8_RHIMU
MKISIIVTVALHPQRTIIPALLVCMLSHFHLASTNFFYFRPSFVFWIKRTIIVNDVGMCWSCNDVE